MLAATYRVTRHGLGENDLGDVNARRMLTIHLLSGMKSSRQSHFCA
ncbi:hypothetical protein RRSWK_00278 [Rhodopirellula sp. SWK7]|nr:hypothetical protein RRSWK_00278 [Rhodopirellula sp. SWK7]